MRSTPDDCPPPAECAVAECNAGACSQSFLPADSSCGNGVSQVCDGSGNCLGAAGHFCESTQECLTPACADGVCCDSPCDSLCASCSQTGLLGTCVAYGPAENPEGCAPGTCDGAGACASGVALAAGAVGSGSGDSYIVSLDVLSSGEALLAGFFSGGANAGGSDLTSAGGFDILVARLDATGAHLWSKRFGGTSDQFAYAVKGAPGGGVLLAGDLGGSVDFGGGLLTSNGGPDAFLVRLDENGDHVWSKQFGDASSQTLNALSSAPNGDVIAAGDFTGSVDFGGGPLATAGFVDVAVVRMDSAGNHLWSKRFGDANEQRVTALAVDSNGDSWLTGYFIGAGLDFGGGALPYAGSYDVFVAKLDSDGNHLFSASFGDGSDQRGRAIAVGPDGSVAIAGGANGTTNFGSGPLTSAGNFDAFVALFEPTGAPRWSKNFGDANEQQTWGVAIDASGSVSVAGEMIGNADFGGGELSSLGSFDVFVAKLAADSTHLWSHRYGDANADYHNSLAAGPDGSLWVEGSFFGVLDFGSGGQLVNAGGLDSFWAHLLP